MDGAAGGSPTIAEHSTEEPQSSGTAVSGDRVCVSCNWVDGAPRAPFRVLVATNLIEGLEKNAH